MGGRGEGGFRWEGKLGEVESCGEKLGESEGRRCDVSYRGASPEDYTPGVGCEGGGGGLV